MRFQKRNQSYKNNSTFRPVLPLVPDKLSEDDEKDKTKYITFDLKFKAGGGEKSPSYKMNMRRFDEGSPQEWMDVLAGLREIWKQNSVVAPADRVATIAAILKGDSLTAFEAALEDARVDDDPEDEDDPSPLIMTQEHVEISLRAVTAVVFPFRALETQKQWMNRSMRKPVDMGSRKAAAALSRINNCLPLFPNGNQSSKYSDSELVGLFEWSLPTSWRKTMDKKSFVPSMHSMKDLIDECERIERNETPIYHDDDDDDSNKNNKKNKFAKNKNNNNKKWTRKTRTGVGRTWSSARARKKVQI